MIGAGAFSDCSEMTSITLPNTIKAIGMNAFSNCKKLSSITFPNSVTDIADRAFDNCSGLTSVKFEGTACQYAIDTDAFWGIGSPSPIELILPDDWNYDAAPANNSTAWHGCYFNSNFYSTEEATDKQNAIAEITAILGEYSTSAYLQSYIAEDVININNAKNRPELNKRKKAATDKLTIAVPIYAGGKAEALGTLGTEQPGPAIEVIDQDGNVLKLYNPKKVNFIKVPAEE